MNFIDLAKQRFSSRKYLEKAVEKEKLEQILEAGRIAPSAVNFQPWRFIVATDEGLKGKICAAYKRDWLQKAPAIIVICGVHSESWRRSDGKDHCDIDAAIAIDHMTLEASELGLGTCWVCNFNSMALSNVLQLPKSWEAVALLPVGYPSEEADVHRHNRLRKNMKDIAFWNHIPE